MTVDQVIALYDLACVIEQPSLGVHRPGHPENPPRPGLFACHFPDPRREIAGVAFAGDTVVSWGRATVTLTRSFDGIEASGDSAEVMSFVTYRFRGERIVHEGHYWVRSAICQAPGVPAAALRTLHPAAESLPTAR